MAGIAQKEIRTPGKYLLDALHLRWAGILTHLPVRIVARLAVRRELLRKGNVLAHALGGVFDFPLDWISGNPLYCARVRHEFLRQLRLRKTFPPGWRKACFEASARRFGPLT